MPQISVLVGDDEKHSLQVSASFWIRNLKISVDGKSPVVNMRSLFQLRKTTSLNMGEREKHTVNVEMFGLYPRLKVWVDEKLIHTG